MKKYILFLMSLSILLSGCTNSAPTAEPIEEVAEVPVVEEPISEANPHDYKELYGFDFDIPIYTDGEIEEANNRITNNYDNFDYYGATNEDIHSLCHDLYVVNQNTFYQLHNMLADFDFEKYNNSEHIETGMYYDEKNELFISISYHYQKKVNYVYVCGKNFEFNKYQNDRLYVGVSGLLDEHTFGKGVIQIGPGSTVEMSPDIVRSYDEFWLRDYKLCSDYYGDMNELFECGYKNEEIQEPIISIY